jgi:SAM-dependent methyltransferase/uncharacterized protein YbaR (Trm112 family)
MQTAFLELLRCPLTHSRLELVVFSEFEKDYDEGPVREVWEGLLHSPTGIVFPITDGIPRILLESMEEHSAFISRHFPSISGPKPPVSESLRRSIQESTKRNRKTKASFSFEWNLLDPASKDKVWHVPREDMPGIYEQETGLSPDSCRQQTVLDAGCGHGLMTTAIAGLSKLAIGVELSEAINDAYRRNTKRNAWFAQADLQYLPFDPETFDVLYSSGVIHHTENTETTLDKIAPVLKKGGRISLWLYRARDNAFHKFMLQARKLTSRLPIRIAFYLLAITIFPFTFLFKKIKHTDPPNAREEMIDLLDGFTPEFREEVEPEQAGKWLEDRGYRQVRVTSSDQYGYSIIGDK